MNTQLLDNPNCLAALKYDIAHSSLMYVQTYLLEKVFFAELFAEYLKRFPIQLLTDHRQAPLARELLTEHDNLTIKTWSRNRTMHTKMLLLWPQQTVYVGSHNLTRGSFSMSDNNTIRVADAAFFTDSLAKFHALYKHGRPVAPDA